MRINFKGLRQGKDYGFCWTGIESYSIRPYGWKEFFRSYWIDRFGERMLSIEEDNLSLIKKKLLEDSMSYLDLGIKEQKEYLLNTIENTLVKNTGFKEGYTNYFINAPETILKNLLSEKEFDLAVVECSNGVRIFVGEEDFLDVSDGGSRVAFIGKQG